MLRTGAFAICLTLMPMAASAVTLQDVVALSHAGVPDTVMTALIDADHTVFTLDAAQLLELRAAGVSETVLLKMLRSRQEFEPQPIALPAVEEAPAWPVAPAVSVVSTSIVTVPV